MAVNVLPIARSSQIARIANHSAALAQKGVPLLVGIVPRNDLEELGQDLQGVVGPELGLQHHPPVLDVDRKLPILKGPNRRDGSIVMTIKPGRGPRLPQTVAAGAVL